MTPCLGSLQPVEESTSADAWYADCLVSLFGTRSLPRLDVQLTELFTLAAMNMAGKMSISGAQEKVALMLSSDGTRLEVAASGGRYILKPETSRFSSVPANEHLTMQMARFVSIEIPPCGLLRLTDDSLAFVIRRFDRLDGRSKLAVEDFCQLAGKHPRDKYDGSAEQCVRLVRRYASEPLIEIQKLFRLLLFTWWTANGDIQLKNFSLLTTVDGMTRLAPACDLVCTRLAIPDDVLAMPVSGRQGNLTRGHWLDFAEYCGLPARAAKRLIDDQIKTLEPAQTLVQSSRLPAASQASYSEILAENTDRLKQ